MKPCRMIDDERKISGVFYNNGEEGWWIGKDKKITKILVYEEAGNGAMVPWIAVYHADEIYTRVAAADLHIHYFTNNPG